MNHRYLKTIASLCLLVTILASGCSQSISLEDLETWDLVIITDNSALGVQYYLPGYVEEDTGKTVILHDYVLAELSAQSVLNALRGEAVNDQFSERLIGFREIVAEAEMIIYFAGNYGDIEGMGGLSGDLMACFSHFACNPPENCTADVYQPYSEVVSEIFSEMLALREGKPTIIRALDFFNPYISGHITCGEEMETACIQCWTTFNAATWTAAEENNIPVVSIYDFFNGEEHTEDPREKGYIGGFGFFPSTEGAEAIAELIRQEGYEPIIP
jgi:hypothetical protein